MQPTFSSSRILLPVRPWFIALTLTLALAANLLPTTYTPFIPDWVAVLLAFWGIREPRRVAMGVAFMLGVVMDVANGSVMGQHALAYVLLAYFATSISRRVLWFPLGEQALHVLPLLLLSQFVQLAARLIGGADFPGWSFFAGPLLATLLWIPGTYLLLLPQYQPVERDHNRPI
jgi:rod shape-determining protein MreD